MKRILVLQRGWVVVGEYEAINAEEVRLNNASVIRRWGTTKGLGQLALGGKQEDTILDACGTVRVHPQTIVMSLDCEPSKWT